MATYFHSYIGAVFITKGRLAIQTWIIGLIDRDANIGPSQSEQKNDLSGHASISNSGPPSSVPTLASVNEMAAQRGLSIRYVPSQKGPDHQPTWMTRCYSKCLILLSQIKHCKMFYLVNNVEKGVGVGRTRKIAKEEAARQAWVAMRW